jgi:hypothetical protein
MSAWSPFARTVTKTMPFPGSEAETVTIQKLGWKTLQDAANENQRKGIDLARQVGPGGLLKELSNAGGESEIRKKTEADPFIQYDRGTLLERGIKAWTVSATVTPEEIAELDAETSEWLAREIYALSKPRTEEERKNA